MSTSQLEKAMATLRISLAEIRNKEGQLDTMISQFRTQLRRVPRQAVYGRMGLDLALAAMGEVEERLSDAENTRRRLLAIKKTATDELEALQLIKQVDEAKKSLSDLRRKVRETGGDAETATEIQQLERFIAAHSKRAEQAITASYEERLSLG